MTGRSRIVAAVAFLGLLALPAAAKADFGIVPGSLSAMAKNSNGTIANQAGSHPYSYTVSFKLNTDEKGLTEGGELRDVIADLPQGLVGNPLAVPRCPRQLFEGIVPQCSPDTQVGVLRAVVSGIGEVRGPVYNLVAPPGIAARIGFSIASANALQDASVRSEEGYGVRVGTFNVPVEVTEVKETIWGVPADPGHDPERGPDAEGGFSSNAPLLPFLTLPTSCDAPPQITVKADSVLNPGVFVEQSALSLDGAGSPVPLAGCDGVPFSPGISATPSTKLAQNPSGLDFELKLPNQGLLAPGGISETQPKKTVFTLPEGVTVNPSLAEGIGVCTPTQYAAEKIDSPAGAGCPEASKIGSVVAKTPLLEEAIDGALYLAAPYDNPFGTLTALYLVARAPEHGVVVKQAGRVDLDQKTGQITTTFDDLPPVPYSSFKVRLSEGARAPLATPSACGSYQSVAKFTPFSAKDDSEAITTTAAFQIERGTDGGACPSGGLPPFRPGLIAGSISPTAGRFSPFNVRIFRTDAEQEITRFSIKLPPGLVGKLAGIPFCSEAQIALAKSRTGPHGGQEELESPSCPAASQIGRSLAGAGVGQILAYVPGKLYLAGSYHGSAISLVAITAAKAGPFDLGTVVIRNAFAVDPETGEVFLDATGSDPIPHIIQGVPVHARDIRAYADRPEFVLNPTSCEKTSTASTLLGSGLDFSSEADDRPVTVSTPFQAADCAALPFRPRLSFKLKGGTKRGDFPALKATLKMNGFGEAGIAKTQVTLPRSEFIENAHFKTICTRVQFKAGDVPGEKCPKGSIYGNARAITPVLDEPLEGPLYLRSSEHQLPDVVASLHNGEIDIVLVGRVDAVKGRLRNTFEATPDAPVKSFVINLQGGDKGLFVNSTNLCKGTHRAIVSFTGHNGKVRNLRPELKANCGGKGRKGREKRKRMPSR